LLNISPEIETLEKQKVSRLRTGVRAVRRLIAGDDAIAVRGVEDLMNRALLQPAAWENIGYITRQRRGCSYRAPQTSSS
jgi:hypothetical protein